MFNHTHSRGFTFIGILLALVIIMILGGYYFKKDEISQTSYVETQLDKSRSAACAVNRQTLSAHVASWSISHSGEQITVEKLRRDGINVPRCPDNVDYEIGSNGEVYCPVHYPPPTHPRAEAQSQAGAIIPGSSSSAPAAGTLERVQRQLGQ
ncbi:hypothetical protein JW926_02660 [Candidatus Sumerlaeota bacterium]|nr:hypothetical protein [Candidatus Sumerlaeota bacterium]